VSSGPSNPLKRRGDSARDRSPRAERGNEPAGETCDVCGSLRVSWRNCKLICADCRSIVKSCADL